MVLLLAASAAAGLLWRSFLRLKSADPTRAAEISNHIQGAATIVGAVSNVVSILLKALWGQQSETTSSTTAGTRRIGVAVGEAA